MDQKNCGGARHSDQDYTSKLLSRACLPLKGCFFRGALVGLGHRSLVDFVLGDDSVPVIVWFADRLPSCGHEWRQVRLYPQDFDDIGVAIKRAWEDKCQDQKCHFALIRPPYTPLRLAVRKNCGLPEIPWMAELFRCAFDAQDDPTAESLRSVWRKI